MFIKINQAIFFWKCEEIKHHRYKADFGACLLSFMFLDGGFSQKSLKPL